MQPSPDEPQKKPKSPWKYFWTALVVFLLLALVVAILPYHKSNQPSRALGEIKTMSVALEAYKADHGNYPSDPNSTEQLQANASFDPEAYIASSAFLYRALSGDPKASNPLDQTKYYMFPATMLKTNAQGQTYIVDSWGNSYGYSTFKAAHPDSKGGYNPTFDLWSTGDGKKAEDQSKWIYNWQNAAVNVGQ